MASFDFTDYTCGYKMEEATGQEAIDEAGNQNLEDNLACPGGSAGKFGFARGTMDHNSRHLQKAFIASSAYDIRGLTDICMAGWFQNNLNFTGDPFSFSIHSATVATGQAFAMRTGAGSNSSNVAPFTWMADGLSLFNLKTLKFDPLVTGPISLDTWYFVAAGWRKDTNILYLFWGKAPGEHYYIERDGFSAGFGYTGVGASTKYGFWSNVGAASSIKADHQLWWNGRELSEDELLILWNDHDGLDFDELSGDTDDDGGLIVAPTAAQSYYYGRP